MAQEPITRLTGLGFYLIRERAGYSRMYFSKWMKEKKVERGDATMRASYSGIRSLEEEEIVPLRYVKDLRLFVGMGVFQRLVTEIQAEFPEAIIE